MEIDVGNWNLWGFKIVWGVYIEVGDWVVAMRKWFGRFRPMGIEW